jgi:hypothetical protein
MLKSPLKNQVERDKLEQYLRVYSQPAETAFLMGRVMALMSAYFVGNVPHGIRVIEAEDWEAALSGYPEWAVRNACRWWKGEENPDRRKKPLEGDIAARCRIEMQLIRFGERAVRRFDENGPTMRKPAPSEDKPITDAQRAETQALVAAFAQKGRRHAKVPPTRQTHGPSKEKGTSAGGAA